MRISRRNFLIGGTMAVTADAALPVADEAISTPPDSVPEGLIGSEPILMNPAEQSMDIAFAVNGEATGWVDVAKSPDMSDSVRIYSGDGPIVKVHDRFVTIRIRGLKPATRYWYRIGADRLEFENHYKPRNLGPVLNKTVYSFTTLGTDTQGSFCVINDTHDRKPIVDMVLTKLAELKPSVIIWNGDARNFYRTVDDAIGTFLKPHPKHPAYAAESPILFLNGNHDFRGRFGIHLEDLMMFRDSAEREIKYAGLGRNFVQRLGDLALIGLDTGEDKQDTNPIMAGLGRMTRYRELQTQWLAEEIEKPTVKTAKFKIAFCHIPLFDTRPNENPGDVLPADDDPRYRHPWASWQRTCANMWGPLFVKAGVQLVVTGHQHVFRYDAPTSGRPWAHIVGGGPDFVPRKSRSFPTVLEGRIKDGQLAITVHDCGNLRIVFKS
ncbi:MAG: metallophosphoesterase [Kiritimatiellae bacterium]|nr:metallophosphoesterase [Kiritimatiellia bacterium]